MKNNLLIIVGIVMTLFMVTAVSSAAEMGEWEGYGGLGYNTYSLEEANDLASDEVDSGISFLVGFKGWVRPKIAIGGEIESMEVEWEDDSYKAGTTGYLGTVNYEFIPGISAFGAAGIYFVELDGFGIDEGDSGFGFKLGVEGDYKISDSLGLQARALYRNNNVEVKDLEMDFSGFGFDTALTYKF
jgi:hypothetical protein